MGKEVAIICAVMCMQGSHAYLNNVVWPKCNRGRLALSALTTLRCDAGQPKRVGVIGGGPAGLATALALLKLPTGVDRVTVFEQKSDLRPRVGGGIQINGAAAVLSMLGLKEEVLAAGNPLERIYSRNVDSSTLLDIHIPELIRGVSAKPPLLMLVDKAAAARKYLLSEDGKVLVFLIMRDKLQELLAASLPPGTLQFNKQLASLEATGDEVVCTFTDGARETFDLVVGCDGLKSKVREEVVGRESPTYSGTRVLFGIAPHTDAPGGRRAEESQTHVHQWFGEGVYGFTASYGGLEGQMWDQIAVVTHEGTFTEENEEWGASEQRAEMLRILERTRMPAELRAIAERADRFFNIGVFLHNPLTPWSKGRLVLVGDAAHAMPPFLGQGANQAIQDAYCLALQLAAIGNVHATLPEALSRYEAVRKFPTAKLTLNSWFLGFIETQEGLGAVFRDNFFRVMAGVGVAQFVFLDGATPKLGEVTGDK